MENKYALLTLMMILLIASPVMAPGLSPGDISDLKDKPDLDTLLARQILETDRLGASYEVRENGDVYFKGLKQTDPIVWIDKKIGNIYHVDSKRDFIENETVSLEFFYETQPDWIKHITHSGKFERYYFPTQWTWTANCSGEFDCNGGWVTFEVFGIEEGIGSSTFPIGTTGPTWANDGQGFGEFDGISSVINGENTSSYGGLLGITFSAWIFSEGAFSGTDSYYYRADSQVIGINSNDAGTTAGCVVSEEDGSFPSSGSQTIAQNEWVHIICTYNSTDIIIYENGVEGGSSSAPNNETEIKNQRLNLGINSGLNSFFNGSLDEVLVYNRSLDQAEITALFNNYTVITEGVNRTGTPTTFGLVLDINFDDYSVADVSGMGNNGVNTNVSFGTVEENNITLISGTDYTITLLTGIFQLINTDLDFTGVTFAYTFSTFNNQVTGVVGNITGGVSAFFGFSSTWFTLLAIVVLVVIAFGITALVSKSGGEKSEGARFTS